MESLKPPMFARGLSAILAIVPVLTALAAGPGPDPGSTAERLAQQVMIVDTHIDVPDRLEERWSDVTAATDHGDFDYERARRGGLNIPFMSIYTPAKAEAEGESFTLANRLIDRVEALVGRAPDRFMLVGNPSQAEQAMSRGLMGLAMGMENGSPLEGKLENIAFFKTRGVSYITLTHALSNHLADSSYDEERRWGGLSPFGRAAVEEMNRLGVMVDISHVSDEAFWQVLEVSKVPVIASHSSARHFTPGWERNMSDEMIRALAEKGGVIQMNFGTPFLTQEGRAWYEAMDREREQYLEENGFDEHGSEASSFQEAYREKYPFPFADMDDLMAQFLHVIDLVGVEHVGVGSDFDGVGDSLPEGMKDVSRYPNLIEAFLEQEYSADQIRAIMGGNLLRVWRQAEQHSNLPAG